MQASDVSTSSLTSSLKPSQTTSLEKPCVGNYELRVQTHLVSLVLLTHQKPSRKPFPTSTLAQVLPCCNQCYLEGRAQCYLLVEESKVDTDEQKYGKAGIVEQKECLGAFPVRRVPPCEDQELLGKVM